MIGAIVSKGHNAMRAIAIARSTALPLCSALLLPCLSLPLVAQTADEILPCGDPNMYVRFHPSNYQIPVGGSVNGRVMAVCEGEGVQDAFGLVNDFEVVDLDAGPGFQADLVNAEGFLVPTQEGGSRFSKSTFILCPVTAAGEQIAGGQRFPQNPETGEEPVFLFPTEEGQVGTCPVPPSDDDFGVADLLLNGPQGAILHRLATVASG